MTAMRNLALAAVLACVMTEATRKRICLPPMWHGSYLRDEDYTAGTGLVSHSYLDLFFAANESSVSNYGSKGTINYTVHYIQNFTTSYAQVNFSDGHSECYKGTVDPYDFDQLCYEWPESYQKTFQYNGRPATNAVTLRDNNTRVLLAVVPPTAPHIPLQFLSGATGKNITSNKPVSVFVVNSKLGINEALSAHPRNCKTAVEGPEADLIVKFHQASALPQLGLSKPAGIPPHFDAFLKRQKEQAQAETIEVEKPQEQMTQFCLPPMWSSEFFILSDNYTYNGTTTHNYQKGMTCTDITLSPPSGKNFNVRVVDIGSIEYSIYMVNGTQRCTRSANTDPDTRCSSGFGPGRVTINGNPASIYGTVNVRKGKGKEYMDVFIGQDNLPIGGANFTSFTGSRPDGNPISTSFYNPNTQFNQNMCNLPPACGREATPEEKEHHKKHFAQLPLLL